MLSGLLLSMLLAYGRIPRHVAALANLCIVAAVVSCLPCRQCGGRPFTIPVATWQHPASGTCFSAGALTGEPDRVATMQPGTSAGHGDGSFCRSRLTDAAGTAGTWAW